ncbi:MAG: hypothetical protein C4560_01520 [Nitrospiraceae bacterium]|nr:MAG: hypothetical protein C4560_01520 [Nitrospiraceae bacterium]
MKTIYSLLILIAVITVGCGGKDKIKPSADSLLATEAINTIDAIRTSYEDKNIQGLQNRTDITSVENHPDLNFETAKLTFTTRLVRITEEFVIVNLSWQGTWHTSGERNLENRGVADLVLQRKTMKLTGIEGDNPFLVPMEK